MKFIHDFYEITVLKMSPNSAHLRTCITVKQRKKKKKCKRQESTPGSRPVWLILQSSGTTMTKENMLGHQAYVFSSRLRGNVVQLVVVLFSTVGDGETEYDKGR
jgi:hypothetical protein